jgi:hypothetical protein
MELGSCRVVRVGTALPTASGGVGADLNRANRGSDDLVILPNTARRTGRNGPCEPISWVRRTVLSPQP